MQITSSYFLYKLMALFAICLFSKPYVRSGSQMITDLDLEMLTMPSLSLRLISMVDVNKHADRLIQRELKLF